MNFFSGKTFWVLVLIAAGILSYRYYTGMTNSNGVKKQEITSESPQGEAINGVITNREISSRRPIAVVVENHPESRPQSGLKDADIVYEGLAEGGITRFLAVFQSKDAENVGPIRSARDYFLQIANAWSALFAHVGGSGEAIAEIKANKYSKIVDIDEFSSGKYFRRVNFRPMPHNAYSSTEILRNFLTDKNLPNTAEYPRLSFQEKDEIPAASTAGKISMQFSQKQFDVGYEFDKSVNAYVRFLAGKPHTDKDSGEQILVKNIIVQLVNITPVPGDPLLHVDMDLKGPGQAFFFINGSKITGQWQADENGQFRYTDFEGKPVEFARGSIWVELLPLEKKDTLIYETLNTNENQK